MKKRFSRRDGALGRAKSGQVSSILSGQASFIRSGQATTEYILILFIGISSFTIVFKSFIKPSFEKLTKAVSARISKSFSGDLHSFPIGRTR